MSTDGNSTTLPAQTIAQSFLKALFGSEWKRAHLCVVTGDPKSSGGWGGGHASRVLSQVKAETNNYFSVSLFRGQLRREAEFERLMCLAVDDVGPKIDPDHIDMLLGPPTWKVETSPGNFQYGYKLEVPITDAAVGTELIKRARILLTGADGDDPGMEGVTRYMRLPCGANLKATLGAKHLLPPPVYQPSSVLRPGDVQHILGQAPTKPSRGQAGTRNSQKPSSPGSPIDEPAVALNPAKPGKTAGATQVQLADEDIELGILRKRGDILGGPRAGGLGLGQYDIRCPFIGEHTDRAESGTAITPGAGKYKCHHGHCINRTYEDFRAKLDEDLKAAGQGGLIYEEFGVIDPAKIDVSQVPVNIKEAALFARYVLMLGRNMFWDLEQDREVLPDDIDSQWTADLKGVLPLVSTPGQRKPKMLSPSRWLKEDKQRGRRAAAMISWPGKPKVFAPDPRRPQRLCVNTWDALLRPLEEINASEVDENAIAIWLEVFWHVIGRDNVQERTIGETILDWLALLIGDPSVKAGWQVVIMGPQGLGKDTIMLPLARTLGDWAQTIQSQQLGADFNEWAGRRLVQVSEIKQNTRGSMTAHDQMNTLKSVFDSTREWLVVNPKYAPKHVARNVVMGWFTSNEMEPLRLEPGDRRFLVRDRMGVPLLPLAKYKLLHRWLVTPDAQGITGTLRVAEFLFRRWETMPDDRRDVLFGIAPWTRDKDALLNRLTDPIDEWVRRCIELAPPHPLAFPDIVTAYAVHERLVQAIKTGAEGLPGGVVVPNISRIVVHLKRAGAQALHGGKLIKVQGAAITLWAVRNYQLYEQQAPQDLARIFTNAVSRGTGQALN